MNKPILSLIFMLFLNGIIFSQEKVSATFEAVEGKVLIYYTLKGEAEKEYDVNVVLKRSDDPSFELVPEDMSGDVGKGKFAGSRKTIIWHIKPEEEALLEGEDFYFEVTAAEIKEGGGFPWVWVIGGAAVAGGTAAYFLLSKDDPAETTNLPNPPGTGRP